MTAILPPKYNYIDLFKDLLDLSNPETRANLLYIGDYQRNADEVDYVGIWTSLAVTLTEAVLDSHEQFEMGKLARPGIWLPGPGIPLFMIGKHLTNNFWYEVTYRSLRALDMVYKFVQDSYFNSTRSFPHIECNQQQHINHDVPIDNLLNSLGCHRIIHYFMNNTPLQKMIQDDLGYTMDDMNYDIARVHILVAFLLAYRAFNVQEYQYAAEYFQTALTMWKQTKIKKSDKLGTNFDVLCHRCIYVSLGYYNLSLPDAHTKYALIKRYFTVAVTEYGYQDPQGQIQKITQMIKSSCLPQKQQDGASLDLLVQQEINNLIKQTEKEENTTTTTITGSNPGEKFPFIIKK